MRFSRYLMIVLVVAATIPCAVMTLLQYRMAKQSIEQEEQVLLQLSESTTKNLINRMDTARHLLLTAAEFVKLEGYEDPKTLNPFLESLRNSFPDFLNIHIDNIHGASIAFAPEVNASNESNIGVDHTDRSHWINRPLSDGVKFSGLVDAKGAATGKIVNLTTPVWSKDGEISGYAVAAVNLEKLASQVLPASFQSQFEILLLDGRGKIIFSSSEGFSKSVLDLSESVRKASGSTVSLRLEHEGNPSQVGDYLAYFSDVQGSDWKVVVLSSEEGYREIILNTIGWNGLAWLLIILATALSSLYVSRPLVESIAKLTSQISAGRSRPLKEEVVIAPEELKHLQHKFSLVSSQLNRANDELAVLNLSLQEEVARQVEKITGQETTMSSVFRSMNEGLLLMDAHGVIQFANQASEHLSSEFSPERNFYRFLKANSVDFVPGSTGQIKLKLKDSQVLSCSFFEVKGFERIKFGALIHDVTAEEQINRLKDDLIGVVAHELKSPLATIRLQTEEILGSEQNAEIKNKLESLLSDTDSMKVLIESWLDVSRLESSAYPIHKELCQLKPLVRKAARLSRAQGEVELKVDIAEEATIVWVDREALVQILSNLFTNAIRYSFPGRMTSIEVKAFRRDNQLELSIADNGVGIESDKLSKVFEKFYQVEMGSKRKPGGTGLGLVIVQGLVRLHEGKITVESQVNEGTVFHITLPYPEK